MHAIRTRIITMVMLALGFGLCALSVTGTASASDQTFWQQVANAFRASHVYVDPGAIAPASINPAQAKALNDTIVASRHPIYLAIVSDARLGSLKAADVPPILHNAMGGAEVIGVGTSHGFHAQGFNLPVSVERASNALTNQVVPASKAANGGAIVPSDIYQRWVNGETTLKASSTTVTKRSTTTHTTTRHVTAVRHGHGSGLLALWVILGVLGVFAIIGIVIWLFNRTDEQQAEADARTVRENNNQARQRSLQRDIDGLTSGLGDVKTDARLNAAASASFTLAVEALSQAQDAVNSGDLDDARRRIGMAEQHYSNVTRALHPQPTPAPAAPRPQATTATAAPRRPAPQPASARQPNQANAVRVQRPNGQPMTITPQNYAPRSSRGMYGGANYGYYYPGGMFGGMYWEPGFYPDRFWGWGYEALLLDEMLITGALMDPYYNDYYGMGGYETVDVIETDTEVDVTETVDEPGTDAWNDSNAGTDGNDGTGTDDSGGGDYADPGSYDGGGSYTPDPEPSGYDGGGSYDAPAPYEEAPAYEPPNYDTGGDFGGGDSGGGGDW